MSKKSKLENAYRNLQMSGAPDLWDRIESGLRPATSNQAERDDSSIQDASRSNPRGLSGRQGRRALTLGAGAALCAMLMAAVLFLPGRRLTVRPGNQADKGFGETGRPAEETAYAAKPQDGMGIRRGDRETDHWTQDGGRKDHASHTGAVPGAADGYMEAAVWYDSLQVTGSAPPTPPEDAAYVPADRMFFTENILADADLLCEARVEGVTYQPAPQGDYEQAVYELSVRRPLYTDGLYCGELTLTVESPLVGGEDSQPLYLMKEGGTYVLPLTFGDGAWQLTYPFAPQIEAVGEDGYIFHTGWGSLVNEQTVVVRKEQQAADDYYYDRMVLRCDREFLPSLTTLAEEAHTRRS